MIAIIKKIIKLGKENTKSERKQSRPTNSEQWQQRGTQYSYASTAPKEDIVTRAKSNVAQNAADTFRQQAHAQVCGEYRSHAEVAPDLHEHKGYSKECAFEDESDLVKRVNDLIVMGYDGNMKFDRDFIAEGVEMLNSFNM